MSLSALLYDPPHSLQHVAYAPAEMLNGHVNVDGTGVAWWPDGATEPLRYVTVQPPWSDPNLPYLASRLTGSPILAAVRSATPGIGYGPANVAPFVDGRLAGAHNGWIGGFRGSIGRKLVAQLSEERFGRLGVMNDSLVLFSLAAQAVEDNSAFSADLGVSEAIRRVKEVVTGGGESATLNLVVAGADRVVAARTSLDYGVNSLYVREGDGGTWLASEPLDESRDWISLPEDSVAVLTPGGVEVEVLA